MTQISQTQKYIIVITNKRPKYEIRAIYWLTSEKRLRLKSLQNDQLQFPSNIDDEN